MPSYFTAAALRHGHYVYLYAVLSGPVLVMFMFFIQYLWRHVHLFPNEEMVIKAMEANMVQWLSARQGAYQCSDSGNGSSGDGVAWTSMEVIRTTFSSSSSSSSLPQWRLDDRIDGALDRLRDHEHVISVKRTDDVYFGTRFPTYSFRCWSNMLLVKMVRFVCDWVFKFIFKVL